MIGLKRGTVKLVSYNPKWKENFAKEKKHLQKASGKDKFIKTVSS